MCAKCTPVLAASQRKQRTGDEEQIGVLGQKLQGKGHGPAAQQVAAQADQVQHKKHNGNPEQHLFGRTLQAQDALFEQHQTEQRGGGKESQRHRNKIFQQVVGEDEGALGQLIELQGVDGDVTQGEHQQNRKQSDQEILSFCHENTSLVELDEVPIFII